MTNNDRIDGNDVLGVLVFDKSREIVAGPSNLGSGLMIVVKGDVANISATDILKMEQSLKSDNDVGAFRLRQLYSYHVQRKLLILGGYCSGEREISWSQ